MVTWQTIVCERLLGVHLLAFCSVDASLNTASNKVTCSCFASTRNIVRTCTNSASSDGGDARSKSHAITSLDVKQLGRKLKQRVASNLWFARLVAQIREAVGVARSKPQQRLDCTDIIAS